MTGTTSREIVDYAESDNAKEMRDAFYNALHDRVMDHIEAHKQVVAKSIMGSPEATVVDEPV